MPGEENWVRSLGVGVQTEPRYAFFSCCCGQITDKQQLQLMGAWVYFGSQFEGTGHRSQEGMGQACEAVSH